MGLLDNLTTQQKVIMGVGGGAAMLFLVFRGGAKKPGAAAGGALAVVDVRRPTDDINAPAGVGAGPGGAGRWSQVLNVNPLWGQDPMGWGRPGPGGGNTGGVGAPPPATPVAAMPPTTQPSRAFSRLRNRLAEQAEDRGIKRMSGNFVSRFEGALSQEEARLRDYRDPKAVEGKKPVMPQGPPVEDEPIARQPQRGIYGTIVNGDLQYLQQGNTPIFGSIVNSER